MSSEIELQVHNLSGNISFKLITTLPIDINILNKLVEYNDVSFDSSTMYLKYLNNQLLLDIYNITINDTITYIIQKLPLIFSSPWAFTALKNGNVISWGNHTCGGDSSNVENELNNIENIYSTNLAFVALKYDNSVITWGFSQFGGDSTTIKNELKNIVKICSTTIAFCALRNDGKVFMWGECIMYHEIKDNLINIKNIYSTDMAFAALSNDGIVLTWGDSTYGGYSRNLELQNINIIYPIKNYGFFAIKNDGNIIIWGGCHVYNKYLNKIINEEYIKHSLVKKIYALCNNIIILQECGNLIIFNDSINLTLELIKNDLKSNIKDICVTQSSLLILRNNGTIYCYGNTDHCANYDKVYDKLIESEIINIYSTRYAFAALNKNGEVIVWGHKKFGGTFEYYDSQQQKFINNQYSNIIKIFSGDKTFAALTNTGKVIIWGDLYITSKIINNKLNQDVINIYINQTGIAAVKNDGSIVIDYDNERYLDYQLIQHKFDIFN